MIGPGIIVKRNDYKGRHYGGPLVARRNQGAGRGFVLWGNCPDDWQSMGGIFCVVAWPDNARGSRNGWRTLREAREAARAVNEGPESGFRCVGLFREHGLLQARGFDAFGRHFNRSFSTRKAAESFLSAMRRGDNRIKRY